MSRPVSSHDTHRYEQDQFDPTGFSLPLFNIGPPAVAPISTRPPESPARFAPPPSSAAHQSRHSVAYATSSSSPYTVSSTLQSPHPPVGTVPSPTSHRVQASMSSALPYAQASYPQSATTYQHMDGLMPPPSSSTSFGSLARSASLGARKKDPYQYSSDDVESGLGNMDVTEEEPSTAWSGYGGRIAQQTQQPSQAYGVAQARDVTMSPSKPGRTYSNGEGQMNPPPLPTQHLSRPPAIRGGSSPSGHSYSQSAVTNPYIPRTSDPGPSAGTPNGQWVDYQRPLDQRTTSSSSYQSPAVDQRSSYGTTAQYDGSPLLNPYDTSSTHAAAELSNMPPSPHQNPAAVQWSNSAYLPSSPPANMRSLSANQVYPATQPVTPAARYDIGPPRNALPSRDGGSTSRVAPSRGGLKDIKNWSDLTPKINGNHSGRRADPNLPGKYLSPLKCLTSALPQTYALCNSQFHYESSDNPRRVLTKPSKPMHNDGVDNEDWDYILFVNDVLGGEHGGDRYLILDVLGQGTFGQVVKCQNLRTHDICAVKVVKNKPAYLNQSKMEVAILDLLNNQYDRADTHHILRMQDSFTHKSHLCLVFECLSSNLYELIKQNQFKGLSTQLVKVFTQQLLECLAVLKEARLIHCDLKPENILLKSLQSPQIKVIDFGSACHEMQTVYTYIQSRFYRSPEVLLGLPYSASIDMWSLGCIIVELFLGLPLFPGTSEYNQVSRIVDMLGNPPQHLLEVGKQTHEFFNYVGIDAQGRKQYQLKSMEQYSGEHRTTEQPSKQYFRQTKLNDIIMEYPYSKKSPKQADIDKEMANRRAFVDFVGGLIHLDPIKRWSPQQAAKHPFITGERYSAPFQPPSLPPRNPSAAPPETPQPSPSSKKYGGLVQSPSASRGQRIYSDAAAYNQQLAQHQSYTAQMQNASTARHQPFSPGYDMHQQNASVQAAYGHGQRIASQQNTPTRQPQWQPMGPPQNFQPRIPSQGLAASASHTSLRAPTNAPMVSAATNPPPNSYYPVSRNRANTINQMDTIPPALARLTQFGAIDPSGVRNLTPIMNRGDEAVREWERRQAGHSKKSSIHSTTYPQLEFLQEQAEIAAAMGGPYMMPGHFGTGRHGHRASTSVSSAQYQMQPGIGISPQNSVAPGVEYRSRRGPLEYEPPPSASSARAYLPTYPPPAATSSNPNSANFDAFDMRDTNMGMMYTPLQPNQAAYHQQAYGGHQARASYSGPYQQAGSANPFIPQIQPPQNQPNSPRYQRRSQGYGV